MLKRIAFLPAPVAACLGFLILFYDPGNADMQSDFANPPLQYRPKGLRDVSKAGTSLTTDGFGGLGELATCANYRSPAFFRKISAALDTIHKLGGSYTLYDEEQFPSGSAGYGRANHGGLCNPLPQGEDLATRYPGNTVKQLNKIDNWVSGPAVFSAPIQSGGTTTLMAVVAMDTADKPQKLIDLTDSVKGNAIIWRVPAGRWDVMVFQCVKSPNPQCDYLDSASVAGFISMAYQPYYDNMPEYFGNTIKYSWYDEPSLEMGSGREWTPLYNLKFMAKWGFSPRVYYPALWYDIGPQTQAARNYLFGFRATLFSEGFIKQVNAWDDAHGVRATGHLDNEDWTDPVGSTGDVIKAFKYSSIPGLDDIGYSYTHLFYKFFSSAAYNWDKSLVNIENGGDYGTAIEQLADGIQMQHTFSLPTPAYNQWHGRCGVMLQPWARHVADIAILYPIAACQGAFYFDGPSGVMSERVPIPYLDYPNVGEILSSQINRDFTWIHPDVLDEKCVVSGPALQLQNAVNHEEYKVIIVPACAVISWSNLRKIRQFYDNGGKVIATGLLPSKSAEFGDDDSVVKVVRAMFPATGQTVTNANGGTSVFLGTATTANMLAALNNAVTVYDVEFEPQTGGLRYIHKVLRDSLNIYFFGNNSAATVNAFARLRGSFTPQQWDPHTGAISTPEYTQVTEGGAVITRVRLNLAALHSVFLTGSYSTTGIVPNAQAGAGPQRARLSVSRSSGNLAITYSIPKGATELVAVRLEVFDVKGGRAAVILDGRAKAGTYTTNWAARRIPGGTYIVRLKVAGQSGVQVKVAKE